MSPTDEELLDLAERVGAACRTRGVTLATAESCTGGLVAHLVTEIPGSSDYFRGALVTYADDVKSGLAGVPTAILEAHGAVSAQTARAMALGARAALGSDVAVADAEGDDVQRHLWTLDRSGNKRASAAAALALVIDRLDAREP